MTSQSRLVHSVEASQAEHRTHTNDRGWLGPRVN